MDKLDEYLEIIYLDEFIILPTIYLGTMIYKKYLSEAARACKNYEGYQKKKCMIVYKIKARRAQLSKIKQATVQCVKDKNPEGCKVKALKEIKKVGNIISDLINKYKDLEIKRKAKI